MKGVVSIKESIAVSQPEMICDTYGRSDHLTSPSVASIIEAYFTSIDHQNTHLVFR